MPHWITHPSELTERLQLRPSRIGVDTEFIRERTYWPQLALVQMAIGEEILLIDPLIPGMTDALKDWLIAPDIVKVMHSASEDLVTFKCACGVLPRPLFDTQIAAALSGVGGGMGYQKLVQEVTGTLLTKGETRSDWMRRPLSPAQLEYAADDVRYLFAIHDALTAKLTAQDRLGWLAEDGERLLGTVEHDDGDRWPHVSLRTAQFLEPAAQRRLLRLLRWRDLQARQSDRPRSWILDNELASQLARFPPADLDALMRQFDKFPKAPRKLANAVWEALNTPLPDEDHAPLAQASTDGNKATLKRLQDAVAQRSRELELPDGILASRRHLETLIEQRSWPAALGQWRRDALEADLLPLLDAVTP
ncbi:ribonuclease D [Xanthomonas campestris pv. campestris]|uniref:ribonuclease D n=1 Tax=Xanthomonas campestris TaxID=339 RepID=UPI001A1416AB|nr:ribonuclease D [Xanthomonas campestris]MBF9171116.1 ribonuclease D [Xanthomonas campestris pv. campestris]MDO0845134.1 ribonuclease D [Xanthomonas campestris pv. campestris]MEA0929389.1 ribonuclease D [Xanthomonas campestris pv. campestris]MEB1413560.1 ribonuclease D [Xanthomonas campestris pv. campestris]MEB1459430.1 ribonuclease D [Xanthomonas campestris pv. campestris]